MRGCMLRKLVPWLGALIGIFALWLGSQLLASESGEIVTLRTQDEAGDVHETRLWVVDHEGSAWLRAGNASAGWFPRLVAKPEVEVERDGVTGKFRAEPTPEARDTINDLMNQKYGFADSYICFFLSRAKKIPVRLVPLNPTP